MTKHGRYSYERGAIAIMQWLHIVESDLLHHELTIAGAGGELLTDVCDGVRLDDVHGLKAKVGEFWYPVATIKIHGPKKAAS